MKFYVDTSVVNVLLFGEFSDIDNARFKDVKKIFEKSHINKYNLVLSIYVLQEIYSFCKKICDFSELEKFSWDTLKTLFKFDLGLLGLLSREERLINRINFNIPDKSDECHIIFAKINHCDGILTYDSHFNSVADKI